MVEHSAQNGEHHVFDSSKNMGFGLCCFALSSSSVRVFTTCACMGGEPASALHELKVSP